MRPESIGSSNTNTRGHAEFLKRASGYGAIGEHPTEEGAIAAWRENLARLQEQG